MKNKIPTGTKMCVTDMNTRGMGSPAGSLPPQIFLGSKYLPPQLICKSMPNFSSFPVNFSAHPEKLETDPTEGGFPFMSGFKNHVNSIGLDNWHPWW